MSYYINILPTELWKKTQEEFSDKKQIDTAIDNVTIQLNDLKDKISDYALGPGSFEHAEEFRNDIWPKYIELVRKYTILCYQLRLWEDNEWISVNNDDEDDMQHGYPALSINHWNYMDDPDEAITDGKKILERMRREFSSVLIVNNIDDIIKIKTENDWTPDPINIVNDMFDAVENTMFDIVYGELAVENWDSHWCG